MKKQEMLEHIKALRLPPQEFVVFGSGPLCVRNMRECDNIDLVVTPALFETCKKLWGADILISQSGTRFERVVCSEKKLEIGTHWNYGWNCGPHACWAYEDLAQTADIFHGIAFASLVDTLLWKQALHRQKDIEDIVLIRTYLKNRMV